LLRVKQSTDQGAHALLRQAVLAQARRIAMDYVTRWFAVLSDLIGVYGAIAVIALAIAVTIYLILGR
jgi:hypothetical protein